MENKNTSWEKVSKWYNAEVDEKGGYYHKNIVIPNSLKLLNLEKNDSLLDLACGQGVLSRHINSDVKYIGVDLSDSLISEAKSFNKNTNADFLVKDITKPINIGNESSERGFTHTAIILALQNVHDIYSVFQNAAKLLTSAGHFLIVINHPYFRIPKFSSWEIDGKEGVQHRRVDAYMSNLEIPIQHEPSKGAKSTITWTYHYSLQYISEKLAETGFVIERIEEWVSDKTSVGKNSQRENVSRKEIPLFMAILCKKV